MTSGSVINDGYHELRAQLFYDVFYQTAKIIFIGDDGHLCNG